MLRPILVLCALFATGAANSPAGTLVRAQNSAASDTVASTFSAEGLTLRITAACSGSGSPCPFRAEVHAAPALAKRIQRVQYTYVPDRRTAPAANTNAKDHFRFEASQYSGELVDADVFLVQSASGAARTVLLQATVPFSAPVSPALPAGLRFEDKYQMQYLEGTPTDYYHFRVRLLGEAAALARIRSVGYRLPEEYFTRTSIRAERYSEYFLEGSASKRNQWDIVAVIRWTNGSTSTHRIPFRPE